MLGPNRPGSAEGSANMATVSRIDVDPAGADEALAAARGETPPRGGAQLEACRAYLRLVVGKHRWSKGRRRGRHVGSGPGYDPRRLAQASTDFKAGHRASSVPGSGSS